MGKRKLRSEWGYEEGTFDFFKLENRWYMNTAMSKVDLIIDRILLIRYSLQEIEKL